MRANLNLRLADAQNARAKGPFPSTLSRQYIVIIKRSHCKKAQVWFIQYVHNRGLTWQKYFCIQKDLYQQDDCPELKMSFCWLIL